MARRASVVAEFVPAENPYLTAGRPYPVISDGGALFTIIDNDGDALICRWNGCAHLRGGSWTSIEIDERIGVPADIGLEHW